MGWVFNPSPHQTPKGHRSKSSVDCKPAKTKYPFFPVVKRRGHGGENVVCLFFSEPEFAFSFHDFSPPIRHPFACTETNSWALLIANPSLFVCGSSFPIANMPKFNQLPPISDGTIDTIASAQLARLIEFMVYHAY